jgi:hypothetical protein
MIKDATSLGAANRCYEAVAALGELRSSTLQA